MSLVGLLLFGLFDVSHRTPKAGAQLGKRFAIPDHIGYDRVPIPGDRIRDAFIVVMFQPSSFIRLRLQDSCSCPFVVPRDVVKILVVVLR